MSIANRLATSILEPGEQSNDGWIAIVNGWWVKANNLDDAERIVETARMAFCCGFRCAKNDIKRVLEE